MLNVETPPHSEDWLATLQQQLHPRASAPDPSNPKACTVTPEAACSCNKNPCAGKGVTRLHHDDGSAILVQQRLDPGQQRAPPAVHVRQVHRVAASVVHCAAAGNLQP